MDTPDPSLLKSQLHAGESLGVNESLASPDKNVRLTLQDDGNLVILDPSKTTLWSSNTPGDIRPVKATLQDDGNLVLYSSSTKPVWSSNSGKPENKNPVLTLQNSGNTTISCADTEVWTTGSAVTDRLVAPNSMGWNQSLFSKNWKYRLLFQDDGNLVLYEQGKGPLWASQTDRAVYGMRMDDNDNLTLTGGRGWSSATKTRQRGGRAELIAQDDGQLVIKSEGTIIWTHASGVIHPLEVLDASPVTAGSNRLSPGQYLPVGQSLVSSNRLYTALLQADGKFTLFDTATKTYFWDSSTTNSAVTKACLSYDGELTIYGSGSSVIWRTNSGGTGEQALIIEDDGYLHIGDKFGVGYHFPTTTTTSSLPLTQSLSLNHRLASPDGKRSLRLLESGDLELIDKDNKASYLYLNRSKVSNAKVLTFARDGYTLSLDVVDSSGQATTVSVFNVSEIERSEMEQREQRERDDRDPRDRDWHGQGRPSEPQPPPSWNLRLQDDGNLGIQRGDKTVWTSGDIPKGNFPGYTIDRLNDYKELHPDQAIWSPNRDYRLIYQKDGNLVLYHGNDGSNPLWYTSTNTSNPGKFVNDHGNLVVYDGANQKMWESHTKTEYSGDAVLYLQDDGNLVSWLNWGGGRNLLFSAKTDGGRAVGQA